MFPWVYEFHWTIHHILFLGAFFSVLSGIALSVGRAVRNSSGLLRAGGLDSLRWHEEFSDLPERARRCRHEFTGELGTRVCPHAFACGECDVHAALTARHREERGLSGGSARVCGVRAPLDRFYHRAHTWVRGEADGTCSIGIDELTDRVLGLPDAVSLPAPGTRLETSSPACTIVKNGREYRALAPIGGRVVDSGGSPERWWITLRPDCPPERAAHLLHGGEIEPWLVREIERIQVMAGGGSPMATLADGGELMPELGGHYSEKVMDDVRAGLLLGG